ncbi:hypothetical protein GCM10010324_49740 [Streptomyces hiroshimensis]|uniref:Uncharacterized protein n=1 Tax=Streptomyces hiroshimensis TaxID=66424 RepID=A0ABQ2YXC6_9ACTN|nr:hypothetical protein [Streptomyces hiroshimensis]GGX97587.1 hypothetical protein GCM10010324_49740 [Streptomyces hiroshimensis]
MIALPAEAGGGAGDGAGVAADADEVTKPPHTMSATDPHNVADLRDLNMILSSAESSDCGAGQA